MFENKTPTLKPPTDGFFLLAKRKLDLSKTRKRNGSKGGKTERITVATEQIKVVDEKPCEQLDMDAFLKRNPQIKNNIYHLSMRLTDGIDWTKLANKLPYSAYRDSTNLYQIVAHYKERVGVKWKAKYKQNFGYTM